MIKGIAKGIGTRLFRKKTVAIILGLMFILGSVASAASYTGLSCSFLSSHKGTSRYFTAGTIHYEANASSLVYGNSASTYKVYLKKDVPYLPDITIGSKDLPRNGWGSLNLKVYQDGNYYYQWVGDSVSWVDLRNIIMQNW